MMLAEWQEAFGEHAPEHLHSAVSAAMRECVFWPAIAEISKPLREIRREAVAELDQATGRGRYLPEVVEFAREGRTEAEEIIHRTAQCLRWRVEAVAKFPPHVGGIAEEVRDVKPASREIGVSSALANSCAARRARGEKTCTHDCTRAKCDLRSGI